MASHLMAIYRLPQADIHRQPTKKFAKKIIKQ